MNRIGTSPWRAVARWARLIDGRELYVLSCTHERIDPPREQVDVERNAVRCTHCVGGVDAVIPIERMPA